MPIATSPFSRALAVTALLGGLALAVPVYAASADDASASGQTPSASASAAGGKHHKGMEDRVETRIKTLHDKLSITPDQESQWENVAQAMRDNETNMKSLIEDRHNNAETMTAVEDLMSYQKIAQAHADGLGKVASAFEPLYDSMSDGQKKNADDVFGKFEGHRGSPPAKTSSKKKAGQ